MEIQNEAVTRVKAQAIRENKEMTKEQISIHLEKIQESTNKLQSLAQKADEIEKKLNTNI